MNFLPWSVVFTTAMLAGCQLNPTRADNGDSSTLADLLDSSDTIDLPAPQGFYDPFSDPRFAIPAPRTTATTAPVPAAEPTPSDTPTPAASVWSDLVKRYELGPLPANIDVQGQWRSAGRNPQLLTDFLGRGRLWMYHIARDIENRGMPGELALLPYVESGFKLTARSYRGAAGPWQLMPATATGLGLTRDRSCDERLDVIRSTDAALDYLETLVARFDGDWLLAIAAYNSGPGRVSKAIKANRSRGLATDFWSLRLPAETRKYIPRLLALAEIVKNPGAFDVTLPALPPRHTFETIELTRAVDLELLARWSDSSVETIRLLNPCFRAYSTPDRVANVVVPLGTADNILSQLASTPADQLATVSDYLVRSGDTLSAIAVRFDTSVADLRNRNGLTSNRIRIGQRLVVGAPAPSAVTGYVVKSGDSLWSIARAYGTTVSALQAINNVGRYLKVGQSISLPAVN